MESRICYSPELINELDKEDKDYPIDPMVLAILNGIKKTIPPSYQTGGAGIAGRGRSYANGGVKHRPDGHNGTYGPYGASYNYQNGPYNGTGRGRGRNISPNVRTTPRRKLFVEEGDSFLMNIKNCLAKLSSENYQLISTQLLEYELDKPDTIDEVVKILHESAINGVFIVDYYVNIFLSAAQKYPKIVPNLNQRILKQINEPQDFGDEEDLLTETKQQKIERWQIANIHIFAELYRKNVYKEELLRKILRSLLQRSETNQFALKLIVELMQKITKTYDRKRRDRDMEEILKKLQEIGKDKKYPGLVRFPVLKCVTEFNDATT